MSKKTEQPKAHSLREMAFVPLAFLTGNPTTPHAVPLSTTAPEGLALVCSARTAPEGDLIRQILRDAGFHVEYVPPMTTGLFGTSGSVHVYVHAREQEEACEFLRQLRETSMEEQEEKDDV